MFLSLREVSMTMFYRGFSFRNNILILKSILKIIHFDDLFNHHFPTVDAPNQNRQIPRFLKLNFWLKEISLIKFEHSIFNANKYIRDLKKSYGLINILYKGIVNWSKVDFFSNEFSVEILSVQFTTLKKIVISKRHLFWESQKLTYDFRLERWLNFSSFQSVPIYHPEEKLSLNIKI